MSPNPPQTFVPPGRVRFRDILYMALFALRGNWMRSALTSLGVIIGIAAVIVMVSVGQGTQAEIDRRHGGRIGQVRREGNGSVQTGSPEGGAFYGAGRRSRSARRQARCR